MSYGSIQPATPLTVVVAILTYRRPGVLATHLPTICARADEFAQQMAHDEQPVAVDVLVIDNDPAGGARATVRTHAPDARYVLEPRPGIAAARNRAVREADSGDLLVFIDDDEEPTGPWLASLLQEWKRSGAAGVAGRVVPDYQARPEAWIEAGEFFVRRTMPTGTPRSAAAAGNLLLDLRQLRPTGISFDEPFGMTGGEDTLMTRRMTAAGLRLVWCDESVVKDRIPADRLTRRWVLRRAWSHGNTAALIDIHLSPPGARRGWVRLTATVGGALRIGAGAAQWARGIVRRSLRDQARGARMIWRGAGFVAGTWGKAYEEYARADSELGCDQFQSSDTTQGGDVPCPR